MVFCFISTTLDVLGPSKPLKISAEKYSESLAFALFVVSIEPSLPTIASFRSSIAVGDSKFIFCSVIDWALAFTLTSLVALMIEFAIVTFASAPPDVPQRLVRE